MVQPGRQYQASTGSYRYSINGQEKDSELNENITTALYWEYDSRIGRRWNVDPKPNVSISPYDCFAGNPILNSDPLGDSIPPKLSMQAQHLEDMRTFAKSIPQKMPGTGAIKFGTGIYVGVMQVLGFPAVGVAKLIRKPILPLVKCRRLVSDKRQNSTRILP